MKANELRIGNWVYYQDNSGDNCEIEFHHGHWLGIHEGNYGLPEPIPLTEEWLLKFGFKESHEGKDYVNYWNQEKECSIDIVENEIFNYRLYGRERMKSLMYVHSLQNLYYSLCGEELTIKTGEEL